jgi:diguanylate cyclase
MNRALLQSRVGFRVLGMFVLAAGIPMLLLAALSQRLVSTQADENRQQVLESAAKLTSIQTFERLNAAREALRAPAQPQVPLTQAPARPDHHSGPAPLSAVVDIARDGSRKAVRGAAQAQRLIDLPLSTPAGRSPYTLHLVQGTTSAENVSVAIEWRDEALGEHRLGLVDPAFLWADAGEPGPNLWLCAVQEDGRPLFCSASGQPEQAARWVASESTAAAVSASEAARFAAKGLFLGASYNAADWFFVTATEPSAPDAASRALHRDLPLAAAAGLLTALLLSAVQVRRTMKPLSSLAAGTREIAARRFDTRLDIRTADEFGELATAFNHMADTLQEQFTELSALAAIDRDIVDQSDLTLVYARIVQRLSQVFPTRPVAIAHINPERPTVAVCHVMRPASPSVSMTECSIDATSLAELSSGAELLRFDGDGSAPAFAQPVVDAAFPCALGMPLRWRDRSFGFLVVAEHTPGELADAGGRQLTDLCNRAAIAASTAQREAALVREARHDLLTGLLNRQGLNEVLASLARRAGAGAQALGVLFVDVDRFKGINDGLGHAAGDKALLQIPDRLQRQLPEGARLARPAGDEFVVVLPEVGVHDAMTRIAQALCEAFVPAIVVEGQPFFLSVSIGIAFSEAPSLAPADLLRHADQAMYEAKRRGGGRYAMFDSRLDAEAQRRAWIERDLPLAAERGQLRLLYQPRVDRLTGSIRSVEALIRWQHPEHGYCSPAGFIPVAEESELIEHIGAWVMDAACAQIRNWRDQGIGDLRVAINLAARQLGSPALVGQLRAAVSRWGVRTQDLEIEITEGSLVDINEATIDRLEELRNLGITIALDDFGTGYSSLSYLRNLPIDILKIDRAFVKDLGRDRSAMAVASAIVAMARSLGMQTVAEGVETPEQLQALSQLKCGEFQGYLFSAPVTAQDIGVLVTRPLDWRGLLERSNVNLGRPSEPAHTLI